MSDTNKLNERNQRIIDEFRTNGGVVSECFEGRTLLLLHTMGAETEKNAPTC